MFRGQPVSEQTVFSQCSALVYVIDAQDEPYQVRGWGYAIYRSTGIALSHL